jgi:hypothetical protein
MQHPKELLSCFRCRSSWPHMTQPPIPRHTPKPNYALCELYVPPAEGSRQNRLSLWYWIYRLGGRAPAPWHTKGPYRTKRSPSSAPGVGVTTMHILQVYDENRRQFGFARPQPAGGFVTCNSSMLWILTRSLAVSPSTSLPCGLPWHPSLLGPVRNSRAT